MPSFLKGEYIAPEKVELVYLKCPLVSQIYVTGNSFQVLINDYFVIFNNKDRFSTI